MDVHALEQMPSFVTDDGSAIRELAGPQPTSGASVNQSLAEATLAPGAETAECCCAPAYAPDDTVLTGR